MSNFRAGRVKNEYVFMRFAARPRRPPAAGGHYRLAEEGSSYDLGQTIPLRGSAHDEEDGTLTGDALIWRLGSIIIGRGTSPEYRPFVGGDQTITLSAGDSGRRVGTATVHIHVGPRTGRPSVFIVSPANGRTFRAAPPCSPTSRRARPTRPEPRSPCAGRTSTPDRRARPNVTIQRPVAAAADEQPAGQTRSITAAIAWPWPMHIVAIP